MDRAQGASCGRRGVIAAVVMSIRNPRYRTSPGPGNAGSNLPATHLEWQSRPGGPASGEGSAIRNINQQDDVREFLMASPSPSGTESTQTPRRGEAIGARIRELRLRAGLTVPTAARNAGVSVTAWSCWERGDKTPLLIRAPLIANALGVPVIALFRTDAIADVVVSAETIEKIRVGGRPACVEAAQRLAARLEPALLEAANQRPVDLSPGARPKRRRTRAEVLAGIRAAKTATAAAQNRRQPAGVVS
jgi:transcriptional regulator with XRE-family HTH domain